VVVVRNGEAALQGLERALRNDSLKDRQDGSTTVAFSADQQDSWVGAWREAPYVAEVEIQSDQKAPFGNHPVPNHLVASPREPLVVNTISQPHFERNSRCVRLRFSSSLTRSRRLIAGGLALLRVPALQRRRPQHGRPRE